MTLQTEPGTLVAKSGAAPQGPTNKKQQVAKPTAFTPFYRSNYDTLARALMWTLGSQPLAIEALDEAFVRAYERWPEVSEYDNPSGWVYRVGLNWARSKRTRLKRSPTLFREEAEPPTPIRDDALWAAIQTLKKDHRAVIVCRFYADWSVAQTADVLQIAEGTVKSRLGRATKQLRTILDVDHEL